MVVGVHTPEFPFEADTENVVEAVRDLNVEFPIALDPEYAVWEAFSNRYWPAVYIADADGADPPSPVRRGRIRRMRTSHPAVCCATRRRRGSATTSRLHRSRRHRGTSRVETMGSPETYVGSQQGRDFAGGARLPKG